MMELFSGEESFIAGLSAVAAWIAALFAYWSYRVSKQQLAMSLAAERKKEPLLASSLIDSFYVVAEGIGRVYAFSISISNSSDSPNSLSRAELEVGFTASDAPAHILRLPHEPQLSARLHGGMDAIRIPIDIASHSTVAGWLFFRLPANLMEGRIKEYRVAVTDAHGGVETISTALLQEENDEARMAKRLAANTTSKTGGAD